MTLRTVAVKLKIPDNAAYTAFTALQRLGVDAGGLERADIWQMHDEISSGFAERFKSNEGLFNPNKHDMQVLENPGPRAGEVWIEDLDTREVPVRMAGVSCARHYVGWRLFGHDKTPAAPHLVKEAAEKLLCNPAIERPITE